MEFRYSSSTRIALYIVSTLLVLLAIFLIAYSFSNDFYLILIGLLLIALAWYLLKEARLSKLILTDDSITLITSISTKTLALNDIQGFRRLGKGQLAIIAKPGTGRRIIINDKFENRVFIETWLEEHTQDIDAINIKEETEAILTNESFGESVNERQAKLNHANKIASVLNIAGFIIFLWAVIYPKPYEPVILILLLHPLIAFVVIYRFKGLIQIGGGNGSAYPSLFIAIFMPCLALAVRGLLDYNIYDYTFLFKPMTIIFLITLMIAYKLCNKLILHAKNKSFTLSALLVCIACYAYGTTILVNGYNDTSTAQVFAVAIKDKHISSGKTTTYYLNLDAWGRYKYADDISVSSKLYNAENIGDSVNVYLKQGSLNIPWFWIEATAGKNP